MDTGKWHSLLVIFVPTLMALLTTALIQKDLTGVWIPYNCISYINMYQAIQTSSGFKWNGLPPLSFLLLPLFCLTSRP